MERMNTGGVYIINELRELQRKKQLAPKILFTMPFYVRVLNSADDYAFDEGRVILYWNKIEKAEIILKPYGKQYYKIQKATAKDLDYIESEKFGIRTQIILE